MCYSCDGTFTQALVFSPRRYCCANVFSDKRESEQATERTKEKRKKIDNIYPFIIWHEFIAWPAMNDLSGCFCRYSSYNFVAMDTTAKCNEISQVENQVFVKTQFNAESFQYSFETVLLNVFVITIGACNRNCIQVPYIHTQNLFHCQ